MKKKFLITFLFILSASVIWAWPLVLKSQEAQAPTQHAEKAAEGANHEKNDLHSDHEKTQGSEAASSLEHSSSATEVAHEHQQGTEHANAEHEAEHHVIDWNRDVIFPFVNLFILILILFFAFRKAVKLYYFNRSKEIAQEIESVQSLKQEIESQHSYYSKKLEGIESEVQQLIQDLKNEGDLVSRKILSEANESLKRIEATIQYVAEQEIKKAKETLKENFAEEVLKQSKELIQKNMSSKDQDHLFSKQVQDVELHI